MNFAHPMALFWGLIALAVVALYLRAVRPRREAATAGLFWDRVLAEGWFRGRWRRWRNPASAAVQLVILALVVLALAEPRWSRPQQIVLVVNNAAGVKAGDAKPAQLAAAKAAAERWIAGLNDYDQMAILSAGPTPTVSSGWTGNRAKLRVALDSIAAVNAAAELPATLALAHWMMADRPGAKIVVLGDESTLSSSLGRTAPSPPTPLRAPTEGWSGERGAGTAAANPPLPRGPLWLFFAGACWFSARWNGVSINGDG